MLNGLADFGATCGRLLRTAFLSEGEGEARIRAAYGDNYERLVEVKNKYDPTNLFRINQNIKPTV